MSFQDGGGCGHGGPGQTDFCPFCSRLSQKQKTTSWSYLGEGEVLVMQGSGTDREFPFAGMITKIMLPLWTNTKSVKLWPVTQHLILDCNIRFYGSDEEGTIPAASNSCWVCDLPTEKMCKCCLFLFLIIVHERYSECFIANCNSNDEKQFISLFYKRVINAYRLSFAELEDTAHIDQHFTKWRSTMLQYVKENFASLSEYSPVSLKAAKIDIFLNGGCINERAQAASRRDTVFDDDDPLDGIDVDNL